VNQTHEQVSDAGPVLGLVEIGVLAVQDRLLEDAFADVIVQRRSRLPEKQRQRLPVPEHVADRLAQAAVGLDLVLLDLLGQPGLQVVHLRAALVLVPL